MKSVITEDFNGVYKKFRMNVKKCIFARPKIKIFVKKQKNIQ